MVKILTRHCIYFLKDCFAPPIWGFGTGKSRVVQRKTLTISFRKLQLWVSRRENILKIVLNPRVNSQYKILVNHLGRKENKHHHQQQQQQQQETWHKINSWKLLLSKTRGKISSFLLNVLVKTLILFSGSKIVHSYNNSINPSF